MKALTVIRLLEPEVKKLPPLLVDTIISEYGKDPFLILISCLLSLRAKDIVTIHVCRALFARAKTPKALLLLPAATLEKIIFTSGFYKTKAKVLRSVCRELIDVYGGAVPRSYEQLMSIKGIGPKTANLVIGVAFGKPALCVDTHVHRISNRLGLVKTRTPEQTEQGLKKIVPKRLWTRWNGLLVTWGQHVCVPVSPRCSECAVKKVCKRVGVTKFR